MKFHVITVIYILLFIGAVEESAQIGLHTLLPNAMKSFWINIWELSCVIKYILTISLYAAIVEWKSLLKKYLILTNQQKTYKWMSSSPSKKILSWSIVPPFIFGFGAMFFMFKLCSLHSRYGQFYMGQHCHFFILCLEVVWFYFIFWVHCNEDMDNDAYHRLTLALFYFWVGFT